MDSGRCKIDKARTDQPEWLREAQANQAVHWGATGAFYTLDERVEIEDGLLYARVEARGGLVFWSVVDHETYLRCVDADEREENRRWKYQDDESNYDEYAHDPEDIQ